MAGEAIVVGVSITDQLTGKMERREVPFPKTVSGEVPRIKMHPSSDLAPAIVGLQATLQTYVRKTNGARVHQWKVTLTPDEEEMRRRFLTSTGTVMSLPSEDGRVGAMSDMLTIVNMTLHQISGLGAPEPRNGTLVRLWFGFQADGGEYFKIEASSLFGIEGQIRRAKRDNARRLKLAQWRVPFTEWVFWTSNFKRVLVPKQPRVDEWLTFHKESLGVLFERSFRPLLKSLWRAVYTTNDRSMQLGDGGLGMRTIGHTVVSDRDLSDLIKRQDDVKGSRTLMFDPEAGDSSE